ncbi:MAG: MazF family transcriptional regulator [Planctomycetes bacterium]|nr:MazF family transcriptional regulator [Planctomycetota bacterium]
MVTPTAGSVVLVPFPFSDLSQAKLRPAIVLAEAGRGDWILCQVTSNPYGDPNSIQLTGADLASGSLQLVSYARPGKLFTANQGLMTIEVGKLGMDPLRRVIRAVQHLLARSLRQ